MELPTLSAGAMVALCALVFLAGLIDAAAGGGGLISLPAYLFVGLPAHLALGSNKFSAACGTLFSTGRYLLHGALDWKTAALSALFSFAGSAAGAQFALLLSDRVLKTLLLFLLPCVAAVLLTRRTFGEENHADRLSLRKKNLFAAAIGLFIGCYDGLAGPGTGTFAIMAYCLLMGYDLRTASGNAKLLNLASNLAALATFLHAGTVVYALAVPAAFCGIAGNLLGAGLALKKGARFIRPMLALVLVLLLVKILIDLFISR